MPSRQTPRRKAWMREWQKKRRAALLKAQVIELLRAGVPPERIGKPETLRQRISALLRDRQALKFRIEIQSGGIKKLRDQVATLQALLATQPAMEERELFGNIEKMTAQLLVAQQRITFLEADMMVQWAEGILDDHLRDAEEEYGDYR